MNLHKVDFKPNASMCLTAESKNYVEYIIYTKNNFMCSVSLSCSFKSHLIIMTFKEKGKTLVSKKLNKYIT